MLENNVKKAIFEKTLKLSMRGGRVEFAFVGLAIRLVW